MEDQTPETETVKIDLPLPTETDWFLAKLVNTVNKNTDIGISITLNVRGQIVTGFLIGGATYFEEFSTQFADAYGTEEVRESIAEYKDLYTNSDEDSPPPQYIHLRDAQTLEGKNLLPQGGGTLWRGRLSEVSGFSLGQLLLVSPEEAENLQTTSS